MKFLGQDFETYSTNTTDGQTDTETDENERITNYHSHIRVKVSLPLLRVVV